MASQIYNSLASQTAQKKAASPLPWTTLPKPSVSVPVKPTTNTGGPTLNMNPFGDPNTGPLGTINKALGFPAQKPTSIIGDGKVGPLAPVKPTSMNGSGAVGPLALGIKAKTPDQNITSTSPTLPASQAASVTAPQTPTAPSLYQTAVGGLAGANVANQKIGDRAREIGDKAGEEINSLRQNSADIQGAYRTGAIAPRAQGLAQVVAQTEAAKEQGVIGMATQQLAGNAQALTAQGQTQSAQTAAGSLTQPQSGAAFFGSPETGGQVGSGNSLIDNAVSNAVGLIKSGSSTTDAMATLSALGAPAQQAFINQMRQFDPTWNPTSSNAIAQQNMATAQQNIASAANIQKSVTILHNLADQIIPNMSSTGFNPASTPIGNQTFAQYFANKNPAAVAGIKAGLGDIKNQISNVIAAATGLTPTGVTGVTDSYDFTQMNPQQLHDFLQYIDQYAQSNMQGAQQGIQGATSGYGAYQGATATPGALPVPGANSTGQVIGAAALSIGSALAKGLISSIKQTAQNAGGAISEGAGLGLAAKVLL